MGKWKELESTTVPGFEVNTLSLSVFEEFKDSDKTVNERRWRFRDGEEINVTLFMGIGVVSG